MRLLDLFERQPPSGDGFRQWFGDSKVVDNSGNPMVVYHGTKDNFELEKMWPWSHFGTSEAANTRAHSSVFNISSQSARVFPVYLSLQKPLRIKDNGLETPEEYAKAILRSGAFSRRERNSISKDWDIMGDDEKFEALEQAVRSKGYDGLVYKNEVEDAGSISFVVFDPRQQVRSVFDLNEATRPFVQRAIDPALMTFSEYRELVDPDQKSHPSDAYDGDLESLNSYQSPEDYETLLNTIKQHGLEFEVRRNTRDMWDGQYVKTTPDGDLVRNEQGKATYLDREEVAMMFPGEKRYRYEFGVIEKSSGQIVANTQDEWGTLLIRTAREYRKFGFGTLLVKLARENRPDRPSGGFTNSGYANLGRVHDEMVREYLSSGFYSHLVKTGQITAERAKEIIAGVQPKKQHQQRNLNTTDPKDWLLMTDGQSFAILYDKKLYELEDLDDDDIRHWIDRHIIGMASLASMGGDSSAWVNRTYGSDQIKGFLIAALLQMEPGEPIRMEPDEAQLAANHLGDKLKEVPKQRPGDFDQYYVEDHDKTWRYMGNREQQYRKHRDPYGEWYARIIEWAEALGD